MNVKEWICNTAKNLHQDQYLEILKIISITNTKYTENNNGIFIDLDKTDDICIQKISDYLKYSQENIVCKSSKLDITHLNNLPSYPIETNDPPNKPTMLSVGMSPDELDNDSDMNVFEPSNNDIDLNIDDDFENNDINSDDEEEEEE